MQKSTFKRKLVATAVISLFGANVFAASDPAGFDDANTGTGFLTSSGAGATAVSTTITPGSLLMQDVNGSGLYQINLINIAQNTGEATSITSLGIITGDASGNVSIGDGAGGPGARGRSRSRV